MVFRLRLIIVTPRYLPKALPSEPIKITASMYTKGNAGIQGLVWVRIFHSEVNWFQS